MSFLKFFIANWILILPVIPANNINPANINPKSIFIYNFTKYIEWPSNSKENDFIIGVLSKSNTLVNELKFITNSRKVGLQAIVVENYMEVDKINTCHILYVAEEKNGDFANVVRKLIGSNTLLISNGDGLAKRGACINFIPLQDKIKFEINLVNTKKHNLKVSDKLHVLATVVID